MAEPTVTVAVSDLEALLAAAGGYGLLGWAEYLEHDPDDHDGLAGPLATATAAAERAATALRTRPDPAIELAAYLAVVGPDLPLTPVHLAGGLSAEVFGCQNCPTLHLPQWDDVLHADRYVLAGDRACNRCANLPTVIAIEESPA